MKSIESRFIRTNRARKTIAWAIWPHWPSKLIPLAVCAIVSLPVSVAWAESEAKNIATEGTQAAAEPAGSRTAISQLRAFISGTASASGRFVQRSVGNKAQAASEGRFVFARPGKFRWEVTQPYPQLLVADGKDVYFHDPDLNQVTIRPMQGALGATPAAILFGTGQLDDSFELAEINLQDGANWLRATPRVREAGFEQIRIGFHDNVPVAMEVLDAFNRTTRFEFSELVRNPSLAADSFDFQVPEGADVVRQ